MQIQRDNIDYFATFLTKKESIELACLLNTECTDPGGDKKRKKQTAN